MTATMVACDVSEFQKPVSDKYPHPWLIFRACDGNYRDHNAPANVKWANAAKASGKLQGFSVYVVYRPGENNSILANLNALSIPTDCTVMIDVESWSGAIKGNHSTEINALAQSLATRQGSQDRVWGYANRGDYANVWPSRPKWLGLVVASYGGSKPDSPGPGPMVGWQYTDGQYSVGSLPVSTPPFGKCDHNQLYITPEDDMPLTPADADLVANAVLSHPLTLAAGKAPDPTTATTTSVSGFILNGWRYAQRAAFAAEALKAEVDALKAEVDALKTAQVSGPVNVTGTLNLGGK